MIALFGRPKEIFETPKTVLTPYRSLTSFNASKVIFALSASELIVNVRTSITISFLEIPYFSASRIIFPAISALPSAVSGIPFSSKVSPTTTPPYFFTNGNTLSMDSCFPFTELIIGFPL